MSDSGHNKNSEERKLKAIFRRLIHNVRVEITTAWKHKNLRKIWDYSVHVIGFISYAVISVATAAFLFVAFLILRSQSRGMKKVSTGTMDTGLIGYFFTLLETVVVAVYRIFAGFLGWGGYSGTPMDIPGRIMGAVSKRVTPSQTTMIFGYATLVFFGWQLISFITTNGGYVLANFYYRVRYMFGGEPEYW